MECPLVSVVVSTRNSAKFLDACLKSINQQSYKNIELIVVDNFSVDHTAEIAKKYADRFFLKGSERSAQVNFGVEQANGKYVYKVDADFSLDRDVIHQCVDQMKNGFDAIIVHNSPDASVSWIAKLRKFEVDMYKYDLTHSSARFVKREIFKKIGGYDEKITAGEDYDFQNKLNRGSYKTGFIAAEAVHLGEPKSLWKHMKRYYSYGRDFINYHASNKRESKKQLSFFRLVYFKNWKRFFANPVTGLGFLIYHFLKFMFGGMGFFVGKMTEPLSGSS